MKWGVIQMSLANNIKTQRRLKNITQQQLSELINKNIRTIQKYEKGETTPSMNVLKDIANALDIDIDVLTSTYKKDNDKDKIEKYKKYATKDKFLYYDKMKPKEMEEMYLIKIKSLETELKTLKTMMLMYEAQNKALEEVLPEDFWEADKIDNYLEMIKEIFNK